MAGAPSADGFPWPGAVRKLPLALPVSDPAGPGHEVSRMDHNDRLGDGTTPVAPDYYSPELVRLCAMAGRVLNEHTNDHDLCAVCSAWPRARAVLLEHNLALL